MEYVLSFEKGDRRENNYVHFVHKKTLNQLQMINDNKSTRSVAGPRSR